MQNYDKKDSKKGGMKAHLGSNAENKPTASRSPALAFSDKNKPKCSTSKRHFTASNEPGV